MYYSTIAHQEARDCIRYTETLYSEENGLRTHQVQWATCFFPNQSVLGGKRRDNDDLTFTDVCRPHVIRWGARRSVLAALHIVNRRLQKLTRIHLRVWKRLELRLIFYNKGFASHDYIASIHSNYLDKKIGRKFKSDKKCKANQQNIKS